MTRASASRLRLAALANALSSPIAQHQRDAILARSNAEMLTAGELWFLDAVAKLSSISDRQRTHLFEIASKIALGGARHERYS